MCQWEPYIFEFRINLLFRFPFQTKVVSSYYHPGGTVKVGLFLKPHAETYTVWTFADKYSKSPQADAGGRREGFQGECDLYVRMAINYLLGRAAGCNYYIARSPRSGRGCGCESEKNDTVRRALHDAWHESHPSLT